MKSVVEMLELDTIRFLEHDYASLVNNGEPGALICDVEPANGCAKILIDDKCNPTLFAVLDGDTWVGTSWNFRSPTRQELNLFEEVDGDLYQEPRDAIDDAMRAYFAEVIRDEITPSREDLSPDRIEKVHNLLHEVWGTSMSGLCIDACAGSGIGSMMIREMGGRPIAYDNDPSLLALGLVSGRFLPENVICINATLASAYMSRAERGMGIMLGQMYVYTHDLWRPIVEELISLSDETLITVATEREALWVCEWAKGVGRDFEVWENDRDPIYDRWVCFG